MDTAYTFSSDKFSPISGDLEQLSDALKSVLAADSRIMDLKAETMI